jgi:hypothetical protein
MTNVFRGCYTHQVLLLHISQLKAEPSHTVYISNLYYRGLPHCRTARLRADDINCRTATDNAVQSAVLSPAQFRVIYTAYIYIYIYTHTHTHKTLESLLCISIEQESQSTSTRTSGSSKGLVGECGNFKINLIINCMLSFAATVPKLCPVKRSSKCKVCVRLPITEGVHLQISGTF